MEVIKGGKHPDDEHPGLKGRVMSVEVFEQLRTMDRWSLSTYVLQMYKRGYEIGWKNAVRTMEERQRKDEAFDSWAKSFTQGRDKSDQSE